VRERYKPAEGGVNKDEAVQERLAEVQGARGVKDRLGAWGQVVSEKEKVIVADADVVQERLAEVKGATGVKDRLTGFLASSQTNESAERKKPIELPTEEPEFDRGGH